MHKAKFFEEVKDITNGTEGAVVCYAEDIVTLWSIKNGQTITTDHDANNLVKTNRSGHFIWRNGLFSCSFDKVIFNDLIDSNEVFNKYGIKLDSEQEYTELPHPFIVDGIPMWSMSELDGCVNRNINKK